MKIGVAKIIKDHLGTLGPTSRVGVPTADTFVFIVFPAALALASVWWGAIMPRDAYSAALTVFGIFAGLLLNIQIAIFGIYQRRWEKVGDDILQEIQDENRESRRLLLKAINSNISYLNLIACLLLVILFIFYTDMELAAWQTGVSIFLMSHFLLTLLMALKRSHALFSKEYDMPQGG